MKQFDIHQYPGLSSEEAVFRLKKDGFNELPSKRSRNFLAIIISIISEPMFFLLIAGGILYLILGSKQEASMLLGFVFFIIGITFYQERKTEKALEVLKHLSSPRALVIREGIEKRIAGREVVREDIVIIREGDIVPADGVILFSDQLLIDESMLTGESVPVNKKASQNNPQKLKPGGDNSPFVFSGTMVVRGYGMMKVQAIGAETEMGKLGKSLKTIEPEETALQKETNRLMMRFAFVGLFICTIVVVVYGLTRLNWLNGFLAGITLAMSVLPQEFSVVLIVFLALGAWRIARKQVLTRRIPVIESLGSATVLCVDKTGTITQNKMSVNVLFANHDFLKADGLSGKPEDLPENFHELIEFSILASQRDPFDPMEKAIKSLGDKYLAMTEHIHHNWELVRQYPLSSELLALSHVWQSPDGDHYVIAAKGAPETIADLCHLTQDQIENLLKQAHIMAGQGSRVIGVARAVFEKTNLPPKQHDFEFELVGLIGLADPVRPEVFDAVKECYSAGMRIIMMTGDYAETAKCVAKEIGLQSADVVITGTELDEMSDEMLKSVIKKTNIFARIVPEQKLRLVNALKANGEIVAMTGDGINDAPALKSAHIGIAMGERGTDVARESAAMVLLNDDFSSIVSAIRLGRRIYDNIKKAIGYIFSIHVPIAGISLIPVLLQWPLIFFPAHIVFLEMIIDPSCSVAFEAEPEEKNIMNRPPRDSKKPLFNKRMIFFSIFQGIVVLCAILAVYLIAIHLGRSEQESRAFTFTTLVMANIGLIFSNRSSFSIFKNLRIKNNAVWYVVAGTLFLLSIVLYVPYIRQLFGFSYLHWNDLLICFVVAFASIFLFELAKMCQT